ncbi:carbohydrate kinase family protein [Pedobacter sp. PWIIR3]
MGIIQPTIYCFGEVLWDIFPQGARAGGAPFNVSYHLMRMGVNSKMISRIGSDSLGEELLAKLVNWGISTRDIQTDLTYPTGTVIATIDEHNEAHYDIVKPVAWDFIEMNNDYRQNVATADALVFGSLACRNEVSKNTLFELIELAKIKVFDINIRMPYFSVALAKELFAKANIVKMNKAEMKIILEALDKEYTSEDDGVHFIQDTFKTEEIVISKGSKGALYYDQYKRYDFPAIQVTVKDTVGSGDSFLAGFLSKRIAGHSAPDAMQQAIALGAFITSQEGACPDYTVQDFKNFQSANV